MIRKIGLKTIICSYLCLLLSSYLTGCGSSANIKPAAEETFVSEEDELSRAMDLLETAETTFGAEKYAMRIEAAAILNKNGDSEWANIILNEIDTSYLNDTSYALRAQTYSAIAINNGDYHIARGYLNDLRLINAFDSLPQEQQIQIQRTRAEILFDLGEYAESVSARIKLNAFLDTHLQATYTEQLIEPLEDATGETTPATSSLAPQITPRQENENQIWLTVMQLTIGELEKLSNSHSNPIAQGWYQLGLMSKANQKNIRQQLSQLNQWVLTWPEHPASLNLPADLQLLTELVDNQAEEIAILLPFTGKLETASKAIREGIMAAFFHDKANGEKNPTIRLYNTAERDINAVYDDAVLNGAEIIIGPLQRKNIESLALRPSMPVPTLALNNIDNPLGAVPMLFQFSLAVEDEAKQAAKQAWKDGHRRALILAPSNTWGDRSVEAFSYEWQTLGGEVVKDYRYTGKNDYSTVIKKAFQVDKSQQRAREIRSIVGHIEFEPRRREDVDMIFVVGHSVQVRQIKPTLAFHYAGTLPVYSTSHIFSGKSDSKKDRDMNTIMFSTLPWFFNSDSSEKAMLKKYANKNPQLQRLYALGVDIYRVYPRLKQLYEVPHAHYYGETGVLKLNKQGQIERQQSWAKFSRGQAKPL